MIHQISGEQSVESDCDLVLVNKLNEVISEVNNIEAKLLSALPNNTDYAKCAEKIMRNISGRRGYDLYSCDEDIINEIRSSIADIIAAHFA